MSCIPQCAGEEWRSANSKVFHFRIFDADVGSLLGFQRLLSDFIRFDSGIGGIFSQLE